MIHGAGLHHLGFDERVADRLRSATAERSDLEPARVVRAEKGHVVLAFASGEDVVPVPPDVAAGEPAVVGDWLVAGWSPEGTREVVAVADRWSALVRHDPDERRAQVLVANVDVVGLVHGLDRPFKPGRMERFLAAAWESGAEPVVIVTKADLGSADELAAQIGAVALGVDVVVTSSVDGRGVDDLAARLAPSRTGVLLGESGAGKSRLVNALLGEERLRTGSVRDADAKGRHTTTTRQLVPLPHGGVLIDTPGVRAFAPWDAGDGLLHVFADIAEVAGACRFRDCRHVAEPACAVRAAVEAGELDPARVERFLALRDELEDLEARRVEATWRAGEGRRSSP